MSLLDVARCIKSVVPYNGQASVLKRLLPDITVRLVVEQILIEPAIASTCQHSFSISTSLKFHLESVSISRRAVWWQDATVEASRSTNFG
jgi:hypothetical protein